MADQSSNEPSQEPVQVIPPTFTDYWNRFHNSYLGSKSSTTSYLNQLHTSCSEFYSRTPVKIADFKRDYILKNGDERLRLIILSVLSIPLWRISNRGNTSSLLKWRNLGLTFTALGLFLSPEIFNPFLYEESILNEQKND